MLVTGAAAEVARDCLADLLLIRIGVILQERHQCHQYARCAETALRTMRLPESFLDHMQVIGTAKALHCLDVVPIGLDSKHQA